jgi:putative thioredoxin
MAMTSLVYDVNEADFATAVLERSKEVPVLVDFWAAWCGPCRTLSPLLERVTNEAEGRFELAKVDVDANPRLANAFGVQGIPTVIAFRGGAAVSQFTGAVPEPTLRRFLEQIVPPPVDPGVLEAEALAESGDLAGAEARLDQLLTENPANLDAALALAGLMLERGAADEALAVLNRQAPTTEVRRLAAAARLLESGQVDLDSPEAALPQLLEKVSNGDQGRDRARQMMLDIFELLGPDHPQTAEYRRRLASVLF